MMSTATATTANTLTLNVGGTLTVESGGSIDASGRGYPTGTSYPGAVVPGNGYPDESYKLGLRSFEHFPLASLNEAPWRLQTQ
jgi:hypothetical protein